MINARQRDIGPSNDSNPLKFHLANYTTRFTTIHSHAVRNETFLPSNRAICEQANRVVHTAGPKRCCHQNATIYSSMIVKIVCLYNRSREPVATFKQATV